MAKSIIDVEIKDDAFKRFTDLFNKYQEQLKTLPGAWNDVGQAADASAQGYVSMTAALMAQRQALNDIEKSLRKQKQQEKEALDIERKRKAEIRTMWSDIGNIGKSVASTTVNLLKWTGIGAALGGLAGVGSLFGLRNLAGDVSDTRRAAMGYGVSTAQLRSAQINFGRFVDVPSVMETLANAQADLSKTPAFNMIGIPGARNMDPAQLLPMLLSRGRSIYGAGHTLQQDPMVQALGSLGLSLNDLRALHNARQGELEDLERKARLDERDLQRLDETSRNWQDFNRRLSLSGSLIQNAFVDALTPLVRPGGPLDQLSARIADMIQKLSQSGALKRWIDELGIVLQRVAEKIGSPDFDQKVQQFLDDFGSFAKNFHNLLIDIGWIKESPQERQTRHAKMSLKDKLLDPTYNFGNAWEGEFARNHPWAQRLFGWDPNQTGWYNPGVSGVAPAASGAPRGSAGSGGGDRSGGSNPGNIRSSSGAFASYSSPEAGIVAIGRQLQRYEDKAKWGYADTIRKIISIYAPKSENDTETYIRNTVARTGFGENQHLDLHDPNVLAKLISAITKQENYRSSYTPDVVLKILNQSGGQIAVQTNQLAAAK